MPKREPDFIEVNGATMLMNVRWGISVRKLAAAILSFSTFGILPAISFADDQVRAAEQLLESAFACPVPPVSVNEMDSPITSMPRASFSGNSSGFRVVVDKRILFKDDRVLTEAGDRSATPIGNEKGKPVERHSQAVVRANYGDLAGTEVTKQNKGALLVIKCRSGNECLRIQSSSDYGADDQRNSSHTQNEDAFQFCDEETLQNAKAAFDTLIASAPPTPPQQGTSRRVKSSLSYMNLRTSPGLDSIILTQIPAGESIAVDESRCVPGNDGKTRFPFCPVTWNGREGWASASGFE
jgi:Bacterial SH3 domain